MAEPRGQADDEPGSPLGADVMRRRTVRTDGVKLAVWEGPRHGPTLVLLHGYPDSHVVWNRCVDRLKADHHCVVYDVRGAGESEAPPDRTGFRLHHLRSDLIAVLDAVAPSGQVHLVGHDWGSLQGWDAVVRVKSEPRLAGRVATYTSISGPCLDHVHAWMRAAWRGGWQRKREALAQLRHSWYVFAFQVPVLPELALRPINRRLLRTRPRSTYHFAVTLPDDAARGVELYRANMLGRRPPVPGGAYTDVPVQLIVPLRDRYVTPELFRDLRQFVSDLTRVDLDAGHWAPHTHADQVARLISGFVRAHPDDQP